jgi:hypothetical protein
MTTKGAVHHYTADTDDPCQPHDHSLKHLTLAFPLLLGDQAHWLTYGFSENLTASYDGTPIYYTS